MVMNNGVTTKLEKSLRQVQVTMPVSDRSGLSSDQQELFASICRLVFDKQAYQYLWDEPILSQLNWLFQIEPPESTMFGKQVAELRQRAQQAQRVNDLFFRILNRDTPVEEVYEALKAISPTEPSLLLHLKSSNRLPAIREADSPASEKITFFLNFLHEDVGLNLTTQESVKGCLKALKSREGVGVMNALLVRSDGGGALVISLQIKVQRGSGQVRDVVQDREDFKKAIERARLALVGYGFLKQLDDVICTLELTESQYVGSSIGLAAAVGMYGAARGMIIDP